MRVTISRGSTETDEETKEGSSEGSLERERETKEIGNEEEREEMRTEIVESQSKGVILPGSILIV